MNRLQYELSPCLIRWSEDSVDWYPWGAEAFEKAAAEDKPVLLSIGYSACHWCHEMARESYEDPETAMLINRNFVPVKVAKTIVKSFSVYGDGELIFETNDNHNSFVRLQLNRRAKNIRIRFDETWGEEKINIFACDLK